MARHVSQPPFQAQPGERQQGGIVATIFRNAEPRYQNPAQGKARHEIKLDNEMNEEKNTECIQAFRFHDPRKTHWHSEQPVPWYSLRHTDFVSNSASVILQGSICPPRQFNHPWKPGYLLWIKSQTLSGIHSLLSTRFKKHSSTDTFDLTYKAKGHEPVQVTPPSLRNGLTDSTCSLPYSQHLSG